MKNDTIIRVSDDAILIDFLLAKMGGMARASVKQLLSHRLVQVNGGVQTRHDTPLHRGDVVTVLNAKGNIQLRHPKLKMVYEDEHLIVVEKKQGLLTVASRPGSGETTVFSILKAYVRRQNPRNNIYVVHRLDRETSGLLVFAKSQSMQEYMRAYWRQLVTERTYVALIEGCPEKKEGKITTWLTEDKRNAMVFSSPVDDGGQIAITNYKVLKSVEPTDTPLPLMGKGAGERGCSLIELHLETGRTNQIRVHMASIGCPVVGDRKYGHGNEYSPVDRLCLHARVLEFIHPATEKKVRFETAVPKEFLAAVK